MTGLKDFHHCQELAVLELPRTLKDAVEETYLL
jgi:hypothetical protein